MFSFHLLPFELTLNTRAVYWFEESVRTDLIGLFFQYQDVFVTSGKASILVCMCASLPSIKWYLMSWLGQLVMVAKGLSRKKYSTDIQGYYDGTYREG